MGGEDRLGEVTRLLQEAGAGDERARERLYELVYAELRRIAAALLAGERTGHTLQATALVNEAYFKLAGERAIAANHGQFLRGAARAMRRILVDHARGRGRRKRGGDAPREEFSDELAPVLDHPLDVLAVDEALGELERLDPEAAEVVTLRLFAGLTLERIAETLELSHSRVARLFEAAKAFLSRRLARPEP